MQSGYSCSNETIFYTKEASNIRCVRLNIFHFGYLINMCYLCNVMKRPVYIIYLLFSVLACSCHLKKVAVSYIDDIYYKENTPSKSKHKPHHSSPARSNVDPILSGDARALIDEAYSWVGTPYSYGGHSRSGTDCSGYVMEVYRRALNFSMPRSTYEQSEACKDISRDKLRPGDLVFFHNLKHGKVSHVGIYVGGGKFLHASTSRGVMESSLDEEYFDRRFRHGGRPEGLNLK